ncbi:MAG: outer membrane lipoprotein-sorting protein [Flavobacteriaceae bacterium]|nr:outer membrane lipoprotein-sorting protein [Flavobacteriaceae bacterium]
MVFIAAWLPANAQTADEIINNYFETIGGLEKLKALKSTKLIGKVNIGNGMTIPLEITQTIEGYSMVKVNLQGQTLYQGVFDGETLWGSNQMTMKPEKQDTEATENIKLNANDFPDPFIDYKTKGYTVELIGKETIEGTETFKIKLVQEPHTVDGKKVDDIYFYYFDTENFVPIVVENEITSGPGKGMVSQIKFSDYQEEGGIYFPFSMTQGIKDQPGGQEIVIENIELNVKTDKAQFAFPEAVETSKGKN